METHSDLDIRHLKRLTDCTGIIQHATYSLPDRRTGYTTDDNARALIVALKLYNRNADAGILSLAETYLTFLRYAQRSDGRFHNYMNYARRFVDRWGSEDCCGRAVWACGYTLSCDPPRALALTARRILEAALPWAASLSAPRAQACAILGLHHYLSVHSADDKVRACLRQHADALVAAYRRETRGRWQWFEDRLTYANALMPAALFVAHETTAEKRYLEVAEKALSFLCRVQWRRDHFKLVGNRGWYPRGGRLAEYDEQPLDAAALVQAFTAAYRVTRKDEYFTRAQQACDWFHGRNAGQQSLYDRETGGCYDGLTPDGVNLNQGAESLLALLLAHLDIRESREAREGAAA